MSNNETVFAVIRDLILELKDDEADNVTPSSTLESLDLDSLDFVEMQVVVRKRFKVAMDPKAFASRGIQRLDELCSYIVELTEDLATPA